MGDKMRFYTVTLIYKRVVEDVIATSKEEAIGEALNDGWGRAGDLIESEAEEGEDYEP